MYIYIYIYVYTHTHTYIYIYIYIKDYSNGGLLVKDYSGVQIDGDWAGDPLARGRHGRDHRADELSLHRRGAPWGLGLSRN